VEAAAKRSQRNDDLVGGKRGVEQSADSFSCPFGRPFRCLSCPTGRGHDGHYRGNKVPRSTLWCHILEPNGDWDKDRQPVNRIASFLTQ